MSEHAPISPLPSPSTAVDFSEAVHLALNYIAGTEDLPLANLRADATDPVTFHNLNRTYLLVTIIYSLAEDVRVFYVLVDEVAREIGPDFDQARAADQAAQREKYGSLDPLLHARLETIAEDDLLPVSILVTYVDRIRTREERETEVARRHPEGQAAREKGDAVWVVADPALETEIRQTYSQLLAEEVNPLTQPIVEWLEARGYTVKSWPGMPWLTAQVRKRDIQALAKLDGVESIYLIEDEETPASDIAIPTNRMPSVWSQGITGSGIRLAIVETGKINNTVRNCLSLVVTRPGAWNDSIHKSQVAAVAACDSNRLPTPVPTPRLAGAAYTAQVLDAAHIGTQDDAKDALFWAIQSQQADVVNHSGGFQMDTSLQMLDKVYDYVIRQFGVTAVIAAGNDGGNVRTPGKGWNTITVGNMEDQNTVRWAGDFMRSTSNYINPNTGIQKPEVVAPGTNINTVAGSNTGTSFAAPQVAGLAALLMRRNNSLIGRPSVVKAIIMASAVHDVEGSRRLSDKDGAGAIDAGVADVVAQKQGVAGTGANACNVPCWWQIATTNTSPSIGGELNRYFHVKQGDHVRVAIAWLSEASSNGQTDDLRTNYNLHVYRPSGVEMESSSDLFNSYEIVEFIAPDTGQYRIRISRSASGDDNEPSNQLGIVWTRTRTVYRDLWRGNQGWSQFIPTEDDLPQWGGASTWAGPWSSSALPGSGSLQMQSDYVLANKVSQNVWRGDQGWARTVPIVNGVPQWGAAWNWAGPWDINDLPGSGILQAQSDYVIDNVLHQNFWRGNQNWIRTVPIVNGVEVWDSASAWDGPFPENGLPYCGGGDIDLPGCGDIQMLADFIVDGLLHQEYWRGNNGYRRTVPIVGTSPQWGSPSAWSSPMSSGTLPGSGSLQTLNFYPLP